MAGRALAALAASTAVTGAVIDRLHKATGLPSALVDCSSTNFTVNDVTLSLSNSNGSYELPVSVVMDRDAVVSTYVRRSSIQIQFQSPPEGRNATMGEINLLARSYVDAPAALPPLPRYGWGYLWGAKVTAAPWVDCCEETGDVLDVDVRVADAGSAVVISEFQQWLPNGSYPGRNALSNHTWTLRCDPHLGYVWTGDMLLRTNDTAFAIAAGDGSRPPTLEMTNLLVPHLANPWPGTSSAVLTAWANEVPGGVNVTGFAANLIAGARMGTYNLTYDAAGTCSSSGNSAYGNNISVLLAEGLSPVAPSAALEYLGSWNASLCAPPLLQSTCPTWMDQHQVLQLPSVPNDVDGFFSIAPRFRLFILDDATRDFLIANATVIDGSSPGPRANFSNMQRVGQVETWEDEPVRLTEPVKALVQASWLPDYNVTAGEGVNGSHALSVAALDAQAAAGFYAFSSPQPLLRVNVSTAYTVSAWVRVQPSNTSCTVTAFLRADSYDADDFNVPYRPVQRNSSAASVSGAWTRLSLTFTSPTWPSYLDVRLAAIGNGCAYFDDVAVVAD